MNYKFTIKTKEDCDNKLFKQLIYKDKNGNTIVAPGFTTKQALSNLMKHIKQ